MLTLTIDDIVSDAASRKLESIGRGDGGNPNTMANAELGRASGRFAWKPETVVMGDLHRNRAPADKVERKE